MIIRVRECVKIFTSYLLSLQNCVLPCQPKDQTKKKKVVAEWRAHIMEDSDRDHWVEPCSFSSLAGVRDSGLLLPPTSSWFSPFRTA